VGPTAGSSGPASEQAAKLAAFQAELAGYGAPCGNDEIDSLIGAAHDEASSCAFDRDALDELSSAAST
jgi:hypothetical protein